MTLRLRLVLALSAMLIAGLTVFGVVTYRVYAGNEYRRVDTQLRQSADGTGHFMLQAQNGTFGGPPPNDGGGNPNGNRPPDPRFTQFSRLVDSTGTTLYELSPASTPPPKLPTALPASGSFLTTGSTTGSGEWRVYLTDVDDVPGDRIIVAVKTTEVQNSLNQLVLIEAISALALLTLLGVGSWLILRKGLQPLEHMADSARSINAGDLSQRVSPADGKSEVGQLGLALNTMLNEFEIAFQEREVTERKLRQFLADASHELRTPLTSIQGFAELFRLGSASEHVDQGVIVRRIEEESARMKRLVEDLLLLARLDQTRPLNRTSVDLAVLAADACSDAAATSPGREITLDAPEPVVIAGDRDHLRQAIANLMTNALQHTSQSTPIHVSAMMRAGTATLSVRDEGPGLDDEAMSHVFDRFWQADKARVGTGAGLGLSIVQAIAQEHRGTATVANGSHGGAMFTLSLPVASPAEMAVS